MADIEEIRQLFEPSRSMQKYIEALQVLDKQAFAPEILAKALELSQPIDFAKINQRITELNSIFSEAKITSDLYVGEIQRQIGLLDSLKTMGSLNTRVLDISRCIRNWEAASAGITARMCDIGFFDQHQALAKSLLEVPAAYTDFVKHTTARLDEGLAPNVLSGLRGSLNLAASQFLGISDCVNTIIATPSDSETLPSPQTLDVPFAQQEEILSTELVIDEDDITSLEAASPTAQVARQASRVMRLVATCNEAAHVSSIGRDIFKPTTRMLVAYARLEWIRSTNQLQLGELVDCLYYIFYECAGAVSLRFLTEHGGPLDNAECEFIWNLKTLRNKWLRHDVDHGQPSGISSSWSNLATSFRWLGLEQHPTKSEHFFHIHKKLIEEAEKFLVLLSSKMDLK